MATGAAGDAFIGVTGTPANMDSLDLTGLNFSVNKKAGTFTATMLLVNMNSGPGGTPIIWGEGNEYEVVLNDGPRVIWMDAEYPGTLDPNHAPSGANDIPIDANFGHYEAGINGGKLLVSDGTASGVIDPQANTLSLTAPLSAMHIRIGDDLAGGVASSATVLGEPETVRTYVRPYVLQAWGVVTTTPVWPIVEPQAPVKQPVSQLFEPVDSGMNNTMDYIVGGTCVAPAN